MTVDIDHHDNYYICQLHDCRIDFPAGEELQSSKSFRVESKRMAVKLYSD
jgi:hypothetical protein